MRQFTTKDYTEACEVARKILKKERVEFYNAIDVANEGFENGVFVFGKMREYVKNEKRRDKVCLPETCICSKCREIKAGMQFYYRTDYRTNFTYYIQPCIDCHKGIYEAKKKQKMLQES